MDILKKILPSFFVITIIGLGIFSGFYTFSGIGLLIDNKILAVVLALVIQLVIISAIVSFPFVKGLSKGLVFTFYLAFLGVSSSTAYIFIYNQQEGSGEVRSHDVRLLGLASEYINILNKQERQELERQLTTVSEYKRLMTEENSRGNKSGAGPGKGENFYEKEEKYHIEKEKYEGMKAEYKIFKNKYAEVRGLISKKTESSTYALAILSLSEISYLAWTDAVQEKAKLDAYFNSLKSPVERAIAPLLSGNVFAITVISSILWSVLFDVASFIMGVLYIQTTMRSIGIIDRVVGGARQILVGYNKLKRLPEEVNSQLVTHNGESHTLDHERIRRFGARAVAACDAISKTAKLDPLEPLRIVITKLRVLNFSPVLEGSTEDSVSNEVDIGILHSEVETDPLTQSILAFMAMDEVFTIDVVKRAYKLNRANELALDMVIYLLNNSHLLESPHIKEYYPKILEQRFSENNSELSAEVI